VRQAVAFAVVSRGGSSIAARLRQPIRDAPCSAALLVLTTAQLECSIQMSTVPTNVATEFRNVTPRPQYHNVTASWGGISGDLPISNE
jgi:hypothetical protein